MRRVCCAHGGVVVDGRDAIPDTTFDGCCSSVTLNQMVKSQHDVAASSPEVGGQSGRAKSGAVGVQVGHGLKRDHVALGDVAGRFHIFRHTFFARLAMRGVPAKAIQELAGHADLTTTMRYMHLSLAARGQALRLLENPSGNLTATKAEAEEG